MAGARDSYVADHVVLAAPIPALRDMDLTAAGLSAQRHRSIADVPMGTHTKLLMQLDMQPSAHPDWPCVAIFDDPAVARREVFSFAVRQRKCRQSVNG